MSDSLACKIILCIDDDDGALAYHRALLERRGYEVLTATSARRGLELAEVYPVAAVVVDYHMPEMSGHEVAAAIKRMRPHVPIVMVSSDDGASAQPRDAVDAFVSKDEATTRLVSVLGQVCEPSGSRPASDGQS
jgi:CheY-like chemotaxis protein